MVYAAASIAGAGMGLANIVLLAMFCLVIVSMLVVRSRYISRGTRPFHQLRHA